VQRCPIVKLSAKRNGGDDEKPPTVFDSVVLPVLFWTSLQKEPAGAATPLLDVGCGLSPPLLNVQAPGIGVGVGVGVAVGVGVGVGVTVPHLTRIKMEWKLLAARNVKSTGSAGLIAVKVTKHLSKSYAVF